MAKSNNGRKSNGSGSIFYDEKGEKWVAEIQWSDKSGKKNVKKFSGKKQSIVKNKLEDFKKQLLISNGNMKQNDVTFKEFGDYWMESILKNQLKRSSYNRKEITLEYQVYPYIGNIPMNQITHFDVQDMVNNLSKDKLSYSTVKKAYEAVSQCFKQYRIKTATQFNPCEGITLPENTKQDVSDIVFFNEEQRKLIRDEAIRTCQSGKPVYRLGYAIVLLMYSGMRIGELLALTWDDIDIKNKTISISKNAVVVKEDNDNETRYILLNQTSTKTTSGKRIIPMSQMAQTALEEIFKINGDKKYIMSSKNDKQISPRNINRMFHSILKQTGIAKSEEDCCGVHTLRHTFASMLFKNGCSIKVVSDILGHADTKITENIYIHLIQEQKVKAIQDIDKYSD